jgi:tetratricopeptide (TPR) repeat protein
MKATQRHQLKQNDFVVTMARALDVLTANRTRLAIVAVVVVVLLLAVGGVITMSRRRADEAGALLGVAMATAQSQIAPAPSLPGTAQTAGTFPTEQARLEASIAAYQAVIDAYPTSPAARAARYYLGTEYLAAGQLDSAEQSFRAAAEADTSSIYGPSARLGLAEVLTSKGNYDEAIATLTELAAVRDGVLPVDGVLMQLGQTNLAAGRTADADAAFRRIVDEFPTSGYLTDAQARLAEADPANP